MDNGLWAKLMSFPIRDGAAGMYRHDSPLNWDFTASPRDTGRRVRVLGFQDRHAFIAHDDGRVSRILIEFLRVEHS